MGSGFGKANGQIDEYEYTHERIVKTPFLKKLNRSLMPKEGWNTKLHVFEKNSVAKVLKDLQEDDPSFLRKLSDRFGIVWREVLTVLYKMKIRVDNLLDYVDSFEDKPSDQTDGNGTHEVVVSLNHLDKCETCISDEFFCEYRLSGPNPTTIKMCTQSELNQLGVDKDSKARIQQLLDQKPCSSKEKVTLQQLLDEKRLFIVDYSQFVHLQPSVKTHSVHTYGSIALFLLNADTGHLEPICIKIIGYKDGQRFVYPDQDMHWKIAKTIFQSNDGAHQVAFSHLAGTHLVAEAFMVATYRQLQNDHPLFVLLDKHFEGTAFINDAALQVLVNNGGVVDMLISPDIADIREKVAEYTRDVTSKDMTFPARINARHMGTEDCPSLVYRFRDDGILLWNAILQWTNDYLQVYYETDKKVLADKQIQKWLKELASTDGGNIKWITELDLEGGDARSKLAQLLASIVFISSVEHAAVNFPQRTVMQFTGVYPLAIYKGEDVVFENNPTEHKYIQLYPPIAMASLQSQVFQVLGGVHHTELGHYDDDDNTGDYFVTRVNKSLADKTKNVAAKLIAIHGELERISVEISRRNEEDPKHEYLELLPGRIPQSINI